MADMLGVIKKAALEAVLASSPVSLLLGEVISASPLKIRIDQKLILEEVQLVLTRNVTDYEVDMEVNHKTESSGSHSHSHTVTAGTHTATVTAATVGDHGTHTHSTTVSEAQGSTDTNSQSGHQHDYVGTKTFKIKNALKTNETVILARFQGGQKFIVLDRVVNTDAS